MFWNIWNCWNLWNCWICCNSWLVGYACDVGLHVGVYVLRVSTDVWDWDWDEGLVCYACVVRCSRKCVCVWCVSTDGWGGTRMRDWSVMLALCVST